MSHWRVELSAWPRLALDRRREFLLLAGDLGGEWWGQGSVVVPALRDAQRLGRSARARGFFVHVHVHKE